MPQNFRSRNHHPDGYDILKKLGIVERSVTSFSEDDEEAHKWTTVLNNNNNKNTMDNELTSDSEEEVIFEKESFLKQAPHISVKNGFSSLNNNDELQMIVKTNRRGSRLSWHLFLLNSSFFIVGLCLAIIGPTVFSLQSHGFHDSLTGLISVISLNAVGIIIGVIFGEISCTKINVFCWLTFSLFLCAVSTILIPWCTKSPSVLLAFFLQGLFIGLIEKGIYNVYYTTWRTKYKIYQCFYLSLSIGSTLAPLLISSFLSGGYYYTSNNGISQVATVSVNTNVLAPKLLHKRDIVTINETTVSASVNSTSGSALALNYSTELPLNNSSFWSHLCEENGTNCSTSTKKGSSTLSTTSTTTTTTKAKKPLVADGTNIEPLRLRGDANKQQHVPVHPAPIVQHTPAAAPSTSTISKHVSNTASVHSNRSSKMVNFTNSPKIPAENSTKIPIENSTSSTAMTAAVFKSTASTSSFTSTTSITLSSRDHQNKLNDSVNLQQNSENSTTTSTSSAKITTTIDPPVINTESVIRNNISYDSAEPKLFTLAPVDPNATLLSNFVPIPITHNNQFSPMVNANYGINNTNNFSDHVTLNTNQNDSLFNEIWTNVLKSTSGFSDDNFVYVLISIAIFAVFSLYAVTCCLTSCFPSNGECTPPVHSLDDSTVSPATLLTFADLFKNRANLPASFIAILFCFLCSGFENVMSTLLTFYCGPQNSATTGIYATTAFWFGTVLSRFLAIGCYKRFWRTNYLLCCFGISFASCGLIVVFRGFSASSPVLLFCVFIVGLAVGFLSPNTFCWFNEELSPSRWFGTAWLITEQCSRLMVPLIISHWLTDTTTVQASTTAFENVRPSVVPISTLVLLVFLCVVIIFARKVVVETSRLNAAAAHVLMTRKVKSPNGRILEYRRHVDDAEDGFETDE